MIVVGLIAVLSSVSIPIYTKHVRKAKRSEAFLILNSIYKAQIAYKATEGAYADNFDELAFSPPGAVRIDERTLQGSVYTFTMTALSKNGRAGANYQAIATADLDPGDPMMDILMIENDLTILE